LIIVIGELKMVYCKECGKKNDDDAQYCTKCGNYIAEGGAFEKNIEKAAEEFGRKAEQFGKHIEKKAKAFGKSVEKSFNSEAKDCTDCGADLKSDAIFCWKCGNKIE
jgi:uncharacterized membrane protein YvbJ